MKKNAIAFDLETIPNPAVIPLLPEPEPDKRMTPGSEKYIADMAAKKEKQLDQMSLKPAQNMICCFSFCDGEGSGAILLSGTDEAALLTRIWEKLSGYDFFITFNGLKFDVPCLKQHSFVARMRPSVDIDTSKYRIGNHLDCYSILSDWGTNPHGGMDFWAKRLGLPVDKGGVDGSMVKSLWDMGDYQTIMDYAVKDAQMTWLIGDMLMKYYL